MSTNTSDNELDTADQMNEDEDEELNNEEEEEQADEIGDDDEKMESKEETKIDTSSTAGATAAASTSSNIDGISRENWKLLEKVKVTQRQDHLKVKIIINNIL